MRLEPVTISVFDSSKTMAYENRIGRGFDA